MHCKVESNIDDRGNFVKQINYTAREWKEKKRREAEYRKSICKPLGERIFVYESLGVSAPREMARYKKLHAKQ